MAFKKYLIIVSVSLFLFSCTEDNDISVPRNLEDYITSVSNKDLGNVIAYAAGASGNKGLTYIFYYPETGATDVRYYEADNLDIDAQDFSKYRRKNLEIADVFGGKLQQFSRSGEDENWCLVTYILDGKLHISNPIRLKNATKPTSWTNEVTIKFPETLNPKFTWTSIKDADDDIYFQVISENEEDTFVSGTYTNDTFFEYFDTSNVVLNINVPETPDSLEEDVEYLFTMMAVSEDNWVNSVIQETFIPRSLQEYLTVNSTKTIEKATAFAASSKGSQSLSYIYYYPLVGASAMRYYETDNTSVDKTDFNNYRRKKLADEADFGGKLRKYSRTDAAESWCIITYVVDDKLYKSDPIKINNQTKPTEWLTDVNLTIDSSERVKPKFTWVDGIYVDTVQYFQVLTDSDNKFLSGIFTNQKTFQYYYPSTTSSNINTETPPELIFDDTYKFTLMGLNADNWVNLVIQQSFIAE